MIRIMSELPGPKARRYLEAARAFEPRCMSDQVPIVWHRGERCWVEDVDGNVFLDFCSGVLVTNIGHSHPKLVAEIRAQADKVVNSYDFVNEWRPLLAQKLVEITPPKLERAFILSTGAEAVEAALKVARKATGRKEIIAFQGGFHGRTYGALSVGGKKSGAGSRGFGPFLPQVYLAPFAFCYRCAFGKAYPGCDLWCLGYLDWMVETETEGDIAAVISETYQGAAGSIIPPLAWMQGLARWCSARGALLILDEVQASFGRTGKLFAFQHYDVEPDLLCLGKGISSSFPVSALVGSAPVMDCLEPGTMSSTHGGNAFSSRIALRNIEILLEENLTENAAAVGDYMMGRFKEMEGCCEQLGQARGQGLVHGLEIVKSKAGREPDPGLAKAVVEQCWRRGLLMIAPVGLYSNVLRVAPPLVITQEEARLGCDLLQEVLAELSGGRPRADRGQIVATSVT